MNSFILSLLVWSVSAAPTEYPMLWANEYCVLRGTQELTHEQATTKVTGIFGEPTDEVWVLVDNNLTWCPKDETN